MPIYEYRCNDCGFQFDRLMRLSDPNPSCPKQPEETEPCDGETTKLISHSSFSLKGGGWYKDGY